MKLISIGFGNAVAAARIVDVAPNGIGGIDLANPIFWNRNCQVSRDR